MKRLPLLPIEAFVATARALNLTRAAAQMSLTVPALSRRIQLLEHHLGTKLFHRLPRGLSLTEAGRMYFNAIAPSWDRVAEATEQARIPARAKALRVGVMPTFAANWLVPRLGQFHSRYPGVEVELETSPDIIDLPARPDIDCVIRLGQGPWEGTMGEQLLPVDAYPVASPDFIADAPPVAHARDLLHQPLIGSSHQPDFWREWFGGAGIELVQAPQRSFDNLQLVYEASASRMGIAIGLDPLVRPYLDSGRLRRLFPSSVRLSRSFHLLRRSRESDAGAFLVFRDWLRSEAASHLARRLEFS